MGRRKHNVDSVQSTSKALRSKKTVTREEHPLLQLQRLVGNRAVTNLIQRHPEQDGRINEVITFSNSLHSAHKKLWGDHLLTEQSLKFAHERTKENKSSIGILWGKVNQLGQTAGGGSGDVYED